MFRGFVFITGFFVLNMLSMSTLAAAQNRHKLARIKESYLR